MSNDEQQGPGKTRILVVTEKPDEFSVHWNRLRESNFCVDTRQSMLRAVADFARQEREIVVLDLEGLVDDVLDAIPVFRDVRPQTFILALYESTGRSMAREALQRGADAVLVQPFYCEELLAIIERWTSRLQASREDDTETIEKRLSALARVAKGAAHEINNPLTTLSGWLEMMQADDGRPEAEKRRLASLQEETNRIAKVVERLLEFGQEIPAETFPVDINAVMEELVNEAKDGPEDVSVGCNWVEGPLLVRGNRALLKKACGLILDAERDGTDPQRKITVITETHAARWARVRIQHTGRAVAPEALEHVFEPFAVGETDEGRTTLAYPAAYGIVKAHGGNIDVTIDDDNATEFSVLLPKINTGREALYEA